MECARASDQCCHTAVIELITGRAWVLVQWCWRAKWKIEKIFFLNEWWCPRKQPTRWIIDLMKWNESGFRPPLCTYRLNWARRTSWGWWDDWDDTVLQTQDSKFETWRSEAEHATSRSRRLPTILIFTRGWGRNISVSFKPPSPGTEPRTLAWKAAVLTTTLGPPPHRFYVGQHCRRWTNIKRALVCCVNPLACPFGL